MDMFKVTLPQLVIHVQALGSGQKFPYCFVRLQGSCYNQSILLTCTAPVEQTAAIESKLIWQWSHILYLITTDLQTIVSSSEGVMYGEGFQLEWRFIQQQTSFTASSLEDND